MHHDRKLANFVRTITAPNLPTEQTRGLMHCLVPPGVAYLKHMAATLDRMR
jgi:hypothetical protein